MNDADDALYRVRYTSRPSTAVIEALATVMETDPTDAPPLYDTLDLDSLDTLFRQPREMQIPGEVSFPVEDYVFVISSDGWLAVYDADQAATRVNTLAGERQSAMRD